MTEYDDERNQSTGNNESLVFPGPVLADFKKEFTINSQDIAIFEIKFQQESADVPIKTLMDPTVNQHHITLSQSLTLGEKEKQNLYFNNFKGQQQDSVLSKKNSDDKHECKNEENLSLKKQKELNNNKIENKGIQESIIYKNDFYVNNKISLLNVENKIAHDNEKFRDLFIIDNLNSLKDNYSNKEINYFYCNKDDRLRKGNFRREILIDFNNDNRNGNCNKINDDQINEWENQDQNPNQPGINKNLLKISHEELSKLGCKANRNANNPLNNQNSNLFAYKTNQSKNANKNYKENNNINYDDKRSPKRLINKANNRSGACNKQDSNLVNIKESEICKNSNKKVSEKLSNKEGKGNFPSIKSDEKNEEMNENKNQIVSNIIINRDSQAEKRKRKRAILLFLILTSVLLIVAPIIIIFITESKSEKTEYSSSSGKSIYELLSTLKLRCAEHKLLKAFWLHKNSDDFFDYYFHCEAVEGMQVNKTYEIANDYTVIDPNAIHDVQNLSKQTIQCLGKNALIGFEFVYEKDKNRFLYKFRCAEIQLKKESSELSCEKLQSNENMLSFENDPFEDLLGIRLGRDDFLFLNGFQLVYSPKKSIFNLFYDFWVCK